MATAEATSILHAPFRSDRGACPLPVSRPRPSLLAFPLPTRNLLETLPILSPLLLLPACEQVSTSSSSALSKSSALQTELLAQLERERSRVNELLLVSPPCLNSHHLISCDSHACADIEIKVWSCDQGLSLLLLFSVCVSLFLCLSLSRTRIRTPCPPASRVQVEARYKEWRMKAQAASVELTTLKGALADKDEELALACE